MQMRRTDAICFAVFVNVSVVVASLAFGAAERVHLTPQLSPGQSLRYRIESSTKTTGKTTTPIANPEGGSQSSQSIHLLMRLDTLDTIPGGNVRLRAVYDKSSAESESDALDLEASSLADQYNRLEHRSFVFAIGPDGELTEIRDPTAPVSEPSVAQPALSFLQGLFAARGFPQMGIAIGQKWKSEHPLAGAPLSNLLWRAESTYLRDESCGFSSASSPAAGQSSARSGGAADQCAVILTQFDILRRGSVHSDATPDDYRRNGLRTSGAWTGSGESLDSISLSTGLLVASTQSSTQNMDYEITSASTGSTIHRVAKVQTQSEITLLPDRP